MVAMIRAQNVSLARQQMAVLDRVAAASRRARRWLLAMQHPDGGWGLNECQTVRCLWPDPSPLSPFPLHDPPTAATTGRVLQALGSWEMRSGQAAIDRGIAFLRRTQHESGKWTAGHPSTDLWSTWNAIAGLRAVGISHRDRSINNAVCWLRNRQRPEGGWGSGVATACPLQTAWAVLALLAAGCNDQTVADGVRLLIDRYDGCHGWIPATIMPVSAAARVGWQSPLAAITYPLLALVLWGADN
jgi:squalene-hopene/tetraprenyl-beta-curcumene cyclase